MPFMDYWPVGIVAATGAVGYGELRQRVSALVRATESKAEREVVGTQYNEIIRRLDRIEDRVNHKEGRREGD